MGHHSADMLVLRPQNHQTHVVPLQTRQCLGKDFDPFMLPYNPSKHRQCHPVQPQSILQRGDSHRVLGLKAVRIHANRKSRPVKFTLQKSRSYQPQIALGQQALHPRHMNIIARMHPIARPLADVFHRAPRRRDRAIPLVQIRHHPATPLPLGSQRRRQGTAKRFHGNHHIALQCTR